MFPIPKIIHLTYKSIDEIPEKWKDVLPAWKKTHPDWDIKFWTDGDNDALVSEKFSWFKKTFDNFPYKIQKIDAARLMYLYEYGGVYMDMDYIPLKNINSLFEGTNNNIYLTFSSNVNCFTNSFLGSKPGQEFWLDYLRSMIDQKLPWYYTKHFKIMNSTGPSKLDTLVKSFNGVIGYIQPNLIHPCNVCNKSCPKTTETYFQTLAGFTWNSYDTKILNFLYCNYKTIIIVIILLLVILILYIRYEFYKCNICLTQNKCVI